MRRHPDSRPPRRHCRGGLHRFPAPVTQPARVSRSLRRDDPCEPAAYRVPPGSHNVRRTRSQSDPIGDATSASRGLRGGRRRWRSAGRWVCPETIPRRRHGKQDPLRPLMRRSAATAAYVRLPSSAQYSRSRPSGIPPVIETGLLPWHPSWLGTVRKSVELNLADTPS